VLEIDPPRSGSGRWQLGFRDLQYRVKGSVQAPYVVLASGALGSPRLLLRNRGRLPNLSPTLGTRFSGNGDALGAIFDPQAPGVQGERFDFGPTMTSYLDFTAEHHFILADGGLPSNFAGVLGVLRDVNALTGWRRMLLRLKDLGARLGLSDRLVTHRHVRLSGEQPITNSLVFLMIGRDAADGEMRLTWPLRCFDIRWSSRASQALFDAMQATTERLASVADATPYFALKGGPLGKFITVHPLGGAPMADDRDHGVVDEYGKVHGYDGLYIWDGSIVPTSLGVNPSKTIAALAERAAEHFVADHA
jgi:cholesterol oxidase